MPQNIHTVFDPRMMNEDFEPFENGKFNHGETQSFKGAIGNNHDRSTNGLYAVFPMSLNILKSSLVPSHPNTIDCV